MRCKDKEITNLDEVIDILDHTDFIRLAMNNGDFPYIVPINFGYELTSIISLFFIFMVLQLSYLKFSIIQFEKISYFR